MSIVNRAIWILRRRRVLGVSAHFSSVADRATRFGVAVEIGPRTELTNCVMGDGSYVAAGSRVANTDVGRYCSIGPRVLVGGLGSHPTHLLSTHPLFYAERFSTVRGNAGRPDIAEHARTSVGNDVWIGAGAIVLDGVMIGDGAVIAAGAVVVQDVEPYAIVGGVPAKVIRHRFDSETRAALLRIKWWDNDPATVRRLAAALADKGIDAKGGFDEAVLRALIADGRNGSLSD